MSSAIGARATRPRRGLAALLTGLRALPGAVGFIVTTPSTWLRAAAPIAIFAVLFVGFTALTLWAGTELSSAIVGEPGEGILGLLEIWALRLVLWLLGVALAVLASLTFAQPLSGFALESLARQQERALGVPPWPDQPLVASSLRSLRSSLASLAAAVTLLGSLAVLTFFFPPSAVVTVPLKPVLAGLIATFDLLDTPMGLRGRGVRERLAFMAREPTAVLAFGCTLAALLLVPFIGLLVLPFGVVGATRLVVAIEQAGGAAPDSRSGPDVS